MPSIDKLPPNLQALARRLEADTRVTKKPDGTLTLKELKAASALKLITPDEYQQVKKALSSLGTANVGGNTPVVPSTPVYSTTDTTPAAPTTGGTSGPLDLQPQRTGFSDYYAIPVGKNGLKNGDSLVLPVPPDRQGMQVSNIDVSYHAPVRDWDPVKKWENKPTYANFSFDDRLLMKKFVDPEADAGNQPETDNIYVRGNNNDPGSLGAAGKTLRITADNPAIAATEDAMTVNWVRVTYQAPAKEVKEFTFRGDPLPNQEWKGRWVQPGEKLAIDVDPNRTISRVEVQWSDKPDDVPFDQPGKWATGTVTLDGQVVGRANEHVGSPAWNFFDPGQGMKGSKLEIGAQACALKVFDVKVFYAD